MGEHMLVPEKLMDRFPPGPFQAHTKVQVWIARIG